MNAGGRWRTGTAFAAWMELTVIVECGEQSTARVAWMELKARRRAVVEELVSERARGGIWKIEYDYGQVMMRRP